HRDLALAPVDGADDGRIAEADEGAAVVRVFEEQALEQQPIDQLAPAAGAELAADAERRKRRLELAGVLGLAEQVVDDAAAADAARQPVYGRERLLRRLGGVDALHRRNADVADPAGLGVLLAEVAAHRG